MFLGISISLENDAKVKRLKLENARPKDQFKIPCYSAKAKKEEINNLFILRLLFWLLYKYHHAYVQESPRPWK